MTGSQAVVDISVKCLQDIRFTENLQRIRYSKLVNWKFAAAVTYFFKFTVSSSDPLSHLFCFAFDEYRKLKLNGSVLYLISSYTE